MTRLVEELGPSQAYRTAGSPNWEPGEESHVPRWESGGAGKRLGKSNVITGEQWLSHRGRHRGPRRLAETVLAPHSEASDSAVGGWEGQELAFQQGVPLRVGSHISRDTSFQTAELLRRPQLMCSSRWPCGVGWDRWEGLRVTAGLWSHRSHTREGRGVAIRPDATGDRDPAPWKSCPYPPGRCTAHPVILHNWFPLPRSALLEATLFWCLQRCLAIGEELFLCN